MKRLLLVFILILTPFAIFADITISDDNEITVKGFYEGTSGYILKIWSDAATNTTIYNNLKTKITTGSDYFPTALEVPSSGILTVDELRTGVQTGIFVWYLENKYETRRMQLSFSISPLQAYVGDKYYVPSYKIEMYRAKLNNNAINEDKSKNKVYSTLDPYFSTQVADKFSTASWNGIIYHQDNKGTCGICYITLNDYEKDVPGTFQYTSYVTVELWIE